MQTIDELIATRPDTSCNWMEEESTEVFRTTGMSYWHWGYSFEGKSYAFYNTAAQAKAALERKRAKK